MVRTFLRLTALAFVSATLLLAQEPDYTLKIDVPLVTVDVTVDDAAGNTLAAASTLEASVRGAAGDKTAKARQVGALLAERAAEAGISSAVFDRAGYAYHGRVAALADGAREGGLAL